MVKCIDTSVWIPYLVPELLQNQARNLITPLLISNTRIIAPAFAWAEVGSVLRKKVRLGDLNQTQAAELYQNYCQLPIDYLDSDAIRSKTWTIAEQFSLATLYDAAFLAVAELEMAEFWTADQSLINTLNPCPSYVHKLGTNQS